MHMNGRVYDATLGRFLSADPNVQAPANTQSLNRYTYVNNNPLSYTDPSGYFFKKLFKKIGRFFKKYKRVILTVAAMALGGLGALYAMTGYISTSAMAILTPLGQAVMGAAAGFAGGLVSTGSFKGALKGAAFGAVAGGVAGYIGDMSSIGGLAKDVAHGIAQGGISEAFGGDFKSGFMGGFVGHWTGRNITSHIKGTDWGAVVSRTAVAATAGGASAALGGGKFANGAVSAAFAHLFNTEGHRALSPNEIPEGMSACPYDECYIDRADPEKVSSYDVEGPSIREPVSVHPRGALGEAVGFGLSAAGKIFRNRQLEIAGDLYGNFRIPAIAVYDSIVTITTYSQAMRKVYPRDHIFVDLSPHVYWTKSEPKKTSNTPRYLE